MPNLTCPPDNPADPLPPPGTTPYSPRLARYREEFDRGAAERGLPPRSWPA